MSGHSEALCSRSELCCSCMKLVTPAPPPPPPPLQIGYTTVPLALQDLGSYQALNSQKKTAAAVTFHPVEHIPLFHSTIPFHHSSPVIVDYRLSLLMCHEDDAIMHKVAIMHEPQASALCNQVHYCIIRVCHIKRRKLSWACHNCFIAGHGTLPFY